MNAMQIDEERFRGGDRMFFIRFTTSSVLARDKVMEVCKAAMDEDRSGGITSWGPDYVKPVRCQNCRFWEPENAEEGDSYGRCRNDYAPCQNQQTDMNWFCADGEREG